MWRIYDPETYGAQLEFSPWVDYGLKIASVLEP
jgi:hypothetical protein